jgi:predicted permease
MSQIKHALRQLTLRPGFSLVVVLMLALGIGATTAMFSLYHQILLRPLPVPNPEQLVNLASPGPKQGGGPDLAIGELGAQFSYPMFRDLEREQTVLTGLAAHVDFLANLRFGEQPVSGRGALVSGSFFSVLNLEPTLGRLIGPQDEPRVGESAVVVLSYDYWQSQLGGDPSVIGETLTINGRALEIIGVAAAGFTGMTLGVRPQVFVPVTMPLGRPQPTHESRQGHWLYLFGRLAPGVTMDQAAAELNVLHSRILNEVEAPMLLQSQVPGGTVEQFRQRQLTLSSGSRGKSPAADRMARPLELLLGVTALVLLIVCVNIANLLLARGAARAGEMAVRASIGASRGRLVRQLLGESLVLIAIGGASSLLVAALVLGLVTTLVPTGLLAGAVSPGLDSAVLDSTALAFAAGASLVTVLVFGLVPAWRISSADAAEAMKAYATRSSGGRGAVRFRAALTTAQIAFSMVLLVLAGLFTRSLMNVAREDLGMSIESVAQFSISPRLNAYDAERLAELYDRVEEGIAAQPGVLAVGSAWLPVLGTFSVGGPMSVQGVDVGASADAAATWQLVGSGYFDALGVPVLAGRTFTDRDDAGSPPVAVVNEAFARKFNLESPLGRRIGPGQQTTSFPMEIVGVVADTKHTGVKGSMPAIVYFPRRQGAGGIESMFYYVRTGTGPEALLAAIPRVVGEIDADAPVTNLRTMTTTLQDSVYIDRLLSMLSAGFAALATLLAGIGLYGVLAYNVTQRTRELGLRLALGAEPKRLRALVLKQVSVMGLIGAVLGLVAALALGRVAEALLFGLSGRDPVVLAAALAVLAAVVLAGSWLPARRASRIAPTEALRYE